MASAWAAHLKRLNSVGYTATQPQPGTIPRAPAPPSTATLDPVQLQRTTPALEEAWRAQFGYLSPYGREVAQRLGPPWPGGRWTDPGWAKGDYGYWEPRLQRLYLDPYMPGAEMGRVARHEFGHAVQSDIWGEQQPRAFFGEASQGWGGGWEGAAPDPWELYAHYAERPQRIPQQLGSWFPQYEYARGAGGGGWR